MDNIIKAFAGAFVHVFHYRVMLVKALLLPVAVLILNTLLDMFFEWGFALNVISFLVDLFGYVVVAITTHRIVLLGDRAVPEWGLKTISGREIRFLLYLIGFSLVLIVPAQLFGLPIVGWLLGLLAVIYIMGRLSLVFPAIAIDEPLGFRDSWASTENYQGLMFAVVGVFPLLVSIPEIILQDVAYTRIPYTILYCLTTVLIIAALSVAYRLIGEESNSRHH